MEITNKSGTQVNKGQKSFWQVFSILYIKVTTNARIYLTETMINLILILQMLAYNWKFQDTCRNQLPLQVDEFKYGIWSRMKHILTKWSINIELKGNIRKWRTRSRWRNGNKTALSPFQYRIRVQVKRFKPRINSRIRLKNFH